MMVVNDPFTRSYSLGGIPFLRFPWKCPNMRRSEAVFLKQVFCAEEHCVNNVVVFKMVDKPSLPPKKNMEKKGVSQLDQWLKRQQTWRKTHRNLFQDRQLLPLPNLKSNNLWIKNSNLSIVLLMDSKKSQHQLRYLKFGRVLLLNWLQSGFLPTLKRVVFQFQFFLETDVPLCILFVYDLACPSSQKSWKSFPGDDSQEGGCIVGIVVIWATFKIQNPWWIRILTTA